LPESRTAQECPHEDYGSRLNRVNECRYGSSFNYVAVVGPLKF